MLLNENMSITKIFLLNMVMIAAISVFVTGYFWISSEYSKFNEESEYLKKEYMLSQQAAVKNEVEKVIDFIEFKKAQAEERLRQDIKNLLDRTPGKCKKNGGRKSGK